MTRRRVAVLGSTGSVGTQALDVVRNHRDHYEVVALAAGRNTDLLAAQAAEFGVRPDRARSGVDDTEVLAGFAALDDVDVVLNAVVGFAGLPATIAALRAGKRLALANKESLIAGGPVVRAARDEGGGEIVPVDSEHSALYQALRGGTVDEVAAVILTASGGPFRGRTRDDLALVTLEDALKHPTWDMGAKITIDSSTLMNKGLEVIEAHWLFGVPASQIEVVVHPQSIVHSMVELKDGSIIAQMGITDMRLPIQYAFAYPDRWDAPVPFLDLTKQPALEFHEPAWDDFPCLRLAYRALEAERSLPIVLNAANEIAVSAFLEGRLGFTHIPQVIAQAMDAHAPEPAATLADVRRVDAWARTHAAELAQELELQQ